jgi:hypothetical protein
VQPRKERTSLDITWELKAELDEIKAPGQSYNGVIRERVRFWREKKKEYWTRKRGARK